MTRSRRRKVWGIWDGKEEWAHWEFFGHKEEAIIRLRHYRKKFGKYDVEGWEVRSCYLPRPLPKRKKR